MSSLLVMFLFANFWWCVCVSDVHFTENRTEIIGFLSYRNTRFENGEKRRN